MCLVNLFFSDGPPDCGKYCERKGATFPVQPMNAVSNIPTMLLGVYIFSYTGPSKIPPVHQKILGLCIFLLGLFSILFHGLATCFVSRLDMCLMLVVVLYLLFLNLREMSSMVSSCSPELALLIILIVSIVTISMPMDHLKPFAFVVLLFVASSIYRFPHEPRVALSVLILLASLVVWYLSKTGGPLCRPDSLLQGHSLWHLGVALVLYFVWDYMKS